MRTIFFALLLVSCASEEKKLAVQSLQETEEGKENKIYFEGRFKKVESLNEREDRLYLEDTKGNTVTFRSMKFFGSNEISMLKKEGNNVILYYTVFYNKTTKEEEKLIKSMTPLYDF